MILPDPSHPTPPHQVTDPALAAILQRRRLLSEPQAVFTGASAVSPAVRCLTDADVDTHTHTLMDMRTELKAVPHASLGYHFLRVQVKPNGGWGSSRGTEAKVSSRRRSDRVTTVVLVCRVRFLA